MDWFVLLVGAASTFGKVMSGVGIAVLVFCVMFGLMAWLSNRDGAEDWADHERRAINSGVAAMLCAGSWGLLAHGVSLLRGSAWWAAMRAGDQPGAIAAPDIDGTAGAGVVSIIGGVLVAALLVWAFKPGSGRSRLRVRQESRQEAFSA